MSKEILNEGVEFIRPPEDIYNYKIPDKTSVNDEPEVSGDFYILFKDKLSTLKRAISDPEILIDYHINNVVYANSLPKIEEQLEKKLEYKKDWLYNFYYYDENMEYPDEGIDTGYFLKKSLRYPTFMIPYNQSSTPIRFYVDIYKTDGSGNVIEHTIKNPFDTIIDNGGTQEELLELQHHMTDLIINSDQHNKPLKMLAYEFDTSQTNPNRMGIYFDSFATSGSQNYNDILYVGLFFDGFTFSSDDNYLVEIKYSIDKKYELIGDPIIVGGKKVYRIRALKNFGDVKLGDVGGFVESEENLSQFGTCWIYNDGKVIDNAKVIDDAKVYGTSLICDSATIKHDATVGVKDYITKPFVKIDEPIHTNSIFDSQMHGTQLTYMRGYFNIPYAIDNNYSFIKHLKNVRNRFENDVTTDIIIGDKATIQNNAKILLDARITGNAIVKDTAIVGSPHELDFGMHINAKWDKYETSIIYNSDDPSDGGQQKSSGPYGYDETVYKYTDITDSAIIAENAYVRGKITGTSIIKGTSYIHKKVHVQGNSTISKNCVIISGFLNSNYNMIHNSTLEGDKFISGDSTFIDTVVKSPDFECFNSLFSQSFMLGSKYVVGPDTIAGVVSKLDIGEYIGYNSDAKFIRCKSLENSTIIFDLKEDGNNKPAFYDSIFEGSNVLDPFQIKANVNNVYSLLSMTGANATKYSFITAQLDTLIQAKSDTNYLNAPYFSSLFRVKFKNGVLTTAIKYLIDYLDTTTVNPRQIDINNTTWYQPQQTSQLPNFSVYKIIATENFGTVTKGTKGGYVQSFANLSIYNNCWIEMGSIVALKAHVTDDATVEGSSSLIGDCVISDSAKVFSTTVVGGCVMTGIVTSGDGTISNNSVLISGTASVYYALFQGDVTITDNAVVQGRGASNKITYSPYYNYTPDWSQVRNGSLILRDNASIFGNVKLHCTSHIELHNRAKIDSNNGSMLLIGESLELYLHDTTTISNKGTSIDADKVSTITGLTNLVSRGEIYLTSSPFTMFRDPYHSYHLTPSGGNTFIAMYDNSSIDLTMSQITYGTNLIMSGHSRITMNKSVINETSLEMNQWTKVNLKGTNARTITPTVVHDINPVGCQIISSNIIMNDTTYIDMDEDRMQVYKDLENKQKVTACVLAGANLVLNHASYLRDSVIQAEGWNAGDEQTSSWHYMYSTACNKSIYGSADPAKATMFTESLLNNFTPTIVLTQRACLDNVYIGKFSHEATVNFIKNNNGIVDQNLLNVGEIIITLFGEIMFDPRVHLDTVNYDSRSLPVQYFTPDVKQSGNLKGYIKSAFEKPTNKSIAGTEKAILYYIGNYKDQTDARYKTRYYLSTEKTPTPMSDALTHMSPRWRYNKYFRDINIAPIYIAELYRMYQKKNNDNDYTDSNNIEMRADATLPNSFYSHMSESTGEECYLDLENYYSLLFNNTYIENIKFTYDNILNLGYLGDIETGRIGIVNNVYMNGHDYKTKTKTFYLPKDVNIKNKTISYQWFPTSILNLSSYYFQYLLENLSIGLNSGGTAVANTDPNYSTFGKNMIYEPSPLFDKYGKNFVFKHKVGNTYNSSVYNYNGKSRQMIHELRLFPSQDDLLLPPAGEFEVKDPKKRTKRDHYIYVHSNVVYGTIFNIYEYSTSIDPGTMDGTTVSDYDVRTKTTIDGYYKNVLVAIKTGTRMNMVGIGTLNTYGDQQHKIIFEYPIIIGHTSPNEDLNLLYKRPYVLNCSLLFNQDDLKYGQIWFNEYKPPSSLPAGFYADVVAPNNPVAKISQLHRFLNTPQIYGTFTIYQDKILNTLLDNRSALLVSDYNDNHSTPIPFVKEQHSLYDNYRFYLYRYGSQQSGNNTHFRKDISLFKNNIKKMEWFSNYFNEIMMLGFACDGFEVVNGVGYAPFKAVSPRHIKMSVGNSIEKITNIGQIGTTVATVHSKSIYNQSTEYNLFDKEVYSADTTKTRYSFSTERNTHYANFFPAKEYNPEMYIPYQNNIFKSGVIFSWRYPSDIKVMGDVVNIVGTAPLEKGIASNQYYPPFQGWMNFISRYNTDISKEVQQESSNTFSNYLGMSYRKSERNVSENLDVLTVPYNLNNIYPLYANDLNYTYDHVNTFKITSSKYDHLERKQLFESNMYNNYSYDRSSIHLHQELNTIIYPEKSEYPPEALYITLTSNANEYFDVSYFGLPTKLDLVANLTYAEVELGGDMGVYMYPKTMTKYSLMNISNDFNGLNATNDLSRIHPDNPSYALYQSSITNTQLMNPYLYALRHNVSSGALNIYFVNSYISKTSLPFGYKYNTTSKPGITKGWNVYSNGLYAKNYLYVNSIMPLENENGTLTEVHDTFNNDTNSNVFIYNNKKVTTYDPSSNRYYYYGMNAE